MAGDEPESWKSVWARNGYDCEAVFTGTAAYPEMVAIWLDHLRAAMAPWESRQG
jgi:sirohydrochlorin cobaltochelatase